MKFKIASIFGTRPEAIKMVPVVKALEGHRDFDSQVIVTAQHREMLDQVLQHFDIEPTLDLNIMEHRQTLTGVATRALSGLDDALERLQPDLVLVHGDTATTLAGTLAAFHRQIPVGHVEAGLRTYDNYSPFPEEIYRRLTDVVAELLFPPTSDSKANLVRDGLKEESMFITGNTAIDALLMTVADDYSFADPRLREIVTTGAGAGSDPSTASPGRRPGDRKLLVVECPRRENLGEPMHNVFRALRRLVEKHDDVDLVCSVHLNPAVREVVFKHLEGAPRTYLRDPFTYPEWANLLARAHLIVTDSGGLQEEAPALGTPVLLARTTTERPEAIRAGTVKMVGVSEDNIVTEASSLITDAAAHGAMAGAKNPYGDGRASECIVAALEYRFGLISDRPPDFSEE